MSIKKCAVTVGVVALALFVVPSFTNAASVRDIMREIERLQAELAKLDGDTNADSDSSDASIRLIAPDAGDSFQIDSSKKMKVRWQTARIPKNSEVCIFLVPSGSSVGYALPEDGDCTKAKNGSRSKSVRIDDQNFSAGEYYVRVELVSSFGAMLDEDASGVIDLEGETDDEDEGSDSYEGDYALRTSIDGRTVTATARVEFDVRNRCTQSMRLGRIEWGDGEDDNVGAEDSGTSCQDVITHRYDSDGRFTIEFFGRDGSTDKERITIGNDDGNASGSVDADVYDTPNPRINGRAYDTDEVGISIGNGDKIYGSGDIRVNDSRWSHTVSEDLAPGTYRVTLYDGDNNELAHNDIVIMESSTSRARYEGYVGGKLQESTSRVTLTNAMALCASLTARNAGQSIRCEWNGRTVSETTGTLAKANYRAYLNGNTTPSISTNNISEADALANCKLTAKNNPASSIRCTWGTKEIYKAAPAVAKATYRAYLRGNPIPSITTENITEADALANCKLTEKNNPTASIRCTWGTKEIYKHEVAASNVTADVKFVNASETVSQEGTPYGTFRVAFDVSAVDGNIYIPSTGGIDGAVGVLYKILGSNAFGKPSQVLESTASKQGAYFLVKESESKRFTLTVAVQPTASGSFAVALTQLGYNTTAALPSKKITLNPSDFKTDAVAITVATMAKTDVYKLYISNVLTGTTANALEGTSLADCKAKAAANGGKAIKCLWGTKEIYSRVANLGTIEKVDTTTYPDRVTIYWSGKAQYQNISEGVSVTINGKKYITTVNSNVGLIYLPKGSAAKAGDPILVNAPSPISMKASGAVLSLVAGVGAVLAEIPYNLLAIFTFG